MRSSASPAFLPAKKASFASLPFLPAALKIALSSRTCRRRGRSRRSCRRSPTCWRRVEDEGVLARAARERVVAEAAAEDHIARIRDHDVVAAETRDASRGCPRKDLVGAVRAGCIDPRYSGRVGPDADVLDFAGSGEGVDRRCGRIAEVEVDGVVAAAGRFRNDVAGVEDESSCRCRDRRTSGRCRRRRRESRCRSPHRASRRRESPPSRVTPLFPLRP